MPSENLRPVNNQQETLTPERRRQLLQSYLETLVYDSSKLLADFRKSALLLQGTDLSKTEELIEKVVKAMNDCYSDLPYTKDGLRK